LYPKLWLPFSCYEYVITELEVVKPCLLSDNTETEANFSTPIYTLLNGTIFDKLVKLEFENARF